MESPRSLLKEMMKIPLTVEFQTRQCFCFLLCWGMGSWRKSLNGKLTFSKRYCIAEVYNLMLWETEIVKLLSWWNRWTHRHLTLLLSMQPSHTHQTRLLSTQWSLSSWGSDRPHIAKQTECQATSRALCCAHVLPDKSRSRKTPAGSVTSNFTPWVLLPRR